MSESAAKPSDLPPPEDLKLVPTREGYDRWAEIYDGEENPLVMLEEQQVWSMLGEVKGMEVADIGCGTGRHAIPLAAAGARVTAIDFSEAMLQQARLKAGAAAVKFVQHDLTRRFPVPDASFDRVVCCLVLDHIPDLDFFFGELRRLCRADGFVAISVMHPAMTLRGVQARFTDPGTGQKIGPESHVHQTADYLMAALHAGLMLQRISEHAVDAALAKRSPRAAKYLDWPLLLMMRFGMGRG